MQDKEKKINISIDKISLVGKIKEDLLYQYNNGYTTYFELLFDNILLHGKVKRVFVSNQQYTYSYMVENLGFIQWGSSFNIRIEFNPNNLGLLQKRILSSILKYVYDIHYTRIDIALDLYNYDLIHYNIIDLKSRKKGYYYDRNNNIETIYLGSMASNRFIRIYNKAKEQKLPNQDWWRLELQLRDIYINQYLDSLETFFDDIYIFKYKSLENYSVTTRAMIEYLLSDITRFSELDKNSKTRYRKLIKTLELESLSFIFDFISVSKEKTIEYLDYLTSGNIYNYDYLLPKNNIDT